MKRRVTALPPISAEQFKQKFVDNTSSKPTTVQVKPNHVKEKNYKPAKPAKDVQMVDDNPQLSEEEIYQQRLKSRLSSLDCLFSNEKFDSVQDNVRHMEHNFSFYIPDREFIDNLDGLIQYLADKVSIGHTCLFCNRSFTSLDSIRKHMLDKSHNKIAYDLPEEKDEISDYYNFDVDHSSTQNDEGWEDDEDIQSGDEDEVVHQDETKEEGDVHYGDTPFELVLPSGRRIGHRSMQLYYKQRPIQTELTEKKHDKQAVTHKMSDDNALIPAKGSGFGAFGQGQQIIQAPHKGDAKLAKKATRQARDVQKREQFKTKVGYKHNNQKQSYHLPGRSHSPSNSMSNINERDSLLPGQPRKTHAESFKWLIKSGWQINLLLVFVPLSFLSHFLQLNDKLIFISSFLAIIPLAKLLGDATEQVALKLGDTLGGLLNASFGNAVELIVGIVALNQGQLRIVQTSMLGSILSNLLLVLGMSFFAGGIAYNESEFQQTAAQASASVMTLSCITLIIPAAYESSFGRTFEGEHDGLLIISRGTALLLLLIYGAYLYFQLKTHAHLFDTTSEEEDEEPEMNTTAACVALLVITVITSFCADYLVGTIDTVAQEWHLPKPFIGLILLPLVANAAEHVTSVWMASKGKMPLAIGVSIGSSIQIAVCLLPLLLVIGWIIGQPLTLFFNNFETVSLFVSVLLVALIVQDGKSNWLEGAMLVVLYIVLALAFYKMVNSHRDAFFKNPSEFIQSIYDKHGAEGIEERIKDEFHSLVLLPGDMDSIARLDEPSSDNHYNTLVRWTAMVQDTGYGTEMYLSTSATNKCLVYGANEDEEVQYVNDSDALSRIRERTNVYAVEIPGDNRSRSRSQRRDLPTGPKHKFPLDGVDDSLGVLLKIYDNDLASSLRPATNYEFVGILGKSALPRTLDSIEEDGAQEYVVPSLHVVYAQPCFNKQTKRVENRGVCESLLNWLKDEVFDGDELAAYYLLLALVSQTQNRKAGSPIGTLPITLSYPESESHSNASKAPPKILKAVQILSNLSAHIPLSIENLNSRRLYPFSNGDDLHSGSLQLSPSTVLILDERFLGQGTLQDTGVRNVHSIQNVIQSQKLEYGFPFSSFAFDTDLISVVLTDHSKSIIPGTVHIKLRGTPEQLCGELAIPDDAELWREFILQSRCKSVAIPDNISNLIQQSFVDERQTHKQAGLSGEGTSSDDLGRRITMARLLTSLDDFDKSDMNERHWGLITRLEKDRESRGV
ncbi:hypothetical protein E3P94_03204 [Wallemia ichthyophaga]|nr:hypothetical protein E3P95_02992 [Wallemia ichthyophaga]TIA97719.1 hypothetical protein E3P94_03204 [Wallemia ichthyophaga]